MVRIDVRRDGRLMIDPNLTEKFFIGSESKQLQKIYLWARARYAAPWAVFFAVLIRVAASVGPHVQLPAVIGGRASLNLLCAFVSPSGGGKGISDQVGRLAWPTSITELPIGSGEGFAATFMPSAKPDGDGEPIAPVIFNCSEIDILTGSAIRQGSTILGTMKAFAMGELLGSTNATKGNSRHVPAHSYRGCLSIGAQPGHTGVIFNDTTGGLPQRFLWAPTTDPDMPAKGSADPDPLDTSMPTWTPAIDGVVEIGYGPSEVADTIIAAHLARQRGNGEALDGHWMLTRCKVAALLAVMHQRSVVSEQDWNLSAMVMQVSDATRQMLLDHAKIANKARIRDQAYTRATRDEHYEEHRLETVKSSLIGALERTGEQSGSDLRRRLGRPEKRALFDQAIGMLIDDGQVTRVRGEQSGWRYKLSGHGDQGGHPRYSQVNNGDQGGHGDPPSNITDPEPRMPPGSKRNKVSCAKWLDQYVAELRAAGHSIVESSDVFKAGEAAGYNRNNIAVNASKHHAVAVAGRKGNGRTTWSITSSPFS
ncbi:hypothetical protein [Mycolicibacter heraklionensis]|uniref:hypothetical protein n=1 Tax=Mycolicibacter heraklionensis TaxID=512402 RepID=UPI0014288A52|nr:hypothetical protein [Mycolicibacter heraklionensis]